MKIIINDKKHNVSDKQFIGAGAEGTIYKLDDKNCLKHYPKENRTAQNRINKIISLCSKVNEFENIEEFKHIAFPNYIAYEEDDQNEICGFSMKLIPKADEIIAFCFDPGTNKFLVDNFAFKDAETLIFKLFELLKLLHSENIIIGDIQPENIMVDLATFEPYIIDFDSVKFGEFECSTIGMDEYICPKVQALGKGFDNRVSFSKESDVYALSMICFELLTSMTPFDIPVEPIEERDILKSKAISFMSFSQATDKVKGYSVGDKEIFNEVRARLDYIKLESPSLFNHFESVFTKEKKEYLIRDIKRIVIVPDKTHKKTNVAKIKPIRGYTTSKERKDPELLHLFLERFKLKLPV